MPDIDDMYDALDETVYRIDSAIEALRPYEPGESAIGDAVAMLTEAVGELRGRMAELDGILAKRDAEELAEMNRQYERSV